MNRIVGLETEYGCLSSDPAGPPAAVERVRNWFFEKHRLGLADMHQRDWDEPVGNGGFLFNGGRCYVDMGHLEICTPECLSLRDLLRYDRAGDDMLTAATHDLDLAERISFVRNNVDYYSGATFGCHENYLVRRGAPLNEANVQSLLAFLTLRVLYTGAGRVRASPGAEARGDIVKLPMAESDFQISQRADYINNDLFEWVQFNRAIINTRDEPLADPRRFRRLHLLHGDTSVLPATLALKCGTTSLVLDLLEINKLPPVAVADAVYAFRALSHQPDGPWRVQLADGLEVSAVEVLQQFQVAAQREFRGRDAETDALLGIWDDVLRDLDGNVENLVGIVDWVTKRWLYTQFLTAENLPWTDPWLRAQDLEFHAVDPARNLAWPLARTTEPWVISPEEQHAALLTPPADTRAAARSQVMRLLEPETFRYFVDWDMLEVEGAEPLQLLDPFRDQAPEAAAWMKRVAVQRARIERESRLPTSLGAP
ncbi:MAG: peptidase [Pedosphaera sp. Tous-C6FEB]|nr:MAG: peptidase [Pedosphaera sp. Tous-C6FEB]